ncbi:MAG: T9SS type A sorting domain-containing protein [Bacteroidetes bacterium]|nr:T9SS type A sorting domain-containing protein [Bacteroidota bacterium]
MKQNLILFLFAVFLFGACDSNIYRFDNKVKGRNPLDLIGDYVLITHDGDTVLRDTISISRIYKSNYLIERNGQDTLYLGEIRKKKGMYFLNQYDPGDQHWDINAFKIANDSIYNFYSAIWGYHVSLIDSGYFKKYEKTTKEDITTYFIHNEKKETLKAFAIIINDAKGIRFEPLYLNGDTLRESINLSDFGMISRQQTELKFKLYPNPFSDVITIEQLGENEINLRIMDLSGQILKEANFSSSSIKLNLSQLPAGIYIAEISYGRNAASTAVKIVKN